MSEINKEIDTEELHDYTSQILQDIRNSKTKEELYLNLTDYHDNDIADVLEYLTKEERKKLYDALGDEATSKIFAYLEDVDDYIRELDKEDAADIIEEMDADDAIDILEELEEKEALEILELVEQEAKEDIELIHSYDDTVFGSIMTTNFIAVKHGLSVKEIMKELVNQAAENDNISTIYIENEDGTFYGALNLKDLIVARADTDLEPFIITSYPFVYDDEIIEDKLEDLKDYSEDSIPVLDKDNKILGVITSQDIVEVVDESMGEDYAKLAGLTNEEDIEEPLLMSVKKRIPWLIALLCLGLIVSSVVGSFEGIIAQLTIITCFQSLILGMAGNCGTQSLAVTIRVLMDEEIGEKERLRLVFKEMLVGLTNGLILAILSFIVIGLYIMLVKGYDFVFAFSCSGCVGAAIVLSMIVSSFVGTIIPIVLEKIGFDPAVASGPLITTINDLVAVLTYYGLAWLFLIQIMHLA